MILHDCSVVVLFHYNETEQYPETCELLPENSCAHEFKQGVNSIGWFWQGILSSGGRFIWIIRTFLSINFEFTSLESG